MKRRYKMPISQVARRQLVRGAALTALTIASSITPATAQVVQPQGGSSDNPPGSGITDIVVTAQKRTETAQRVPAAVVAVGGEQLAAIGVHDARQLSAIVPAARFEQVRSQVQVTVRGVGQANTGPNADPAVATNVNGIYQFTDTTVAAFFDIDRVEVLPGPQGTLYGRNAAGGAVNIYTRKPGDDFGGNASVEIGNYKTINLEGALDIPVSDTLKLRAAGAMQHHSGYLSNGANDRKTEAGRLTAVFEPSDRLSVTLIGTYTHNGGIGDQGVNDPPVDSDDPWHYPFPVEGRFNRDNVYTVSGQLDYEITDGITFTYLAGYDHFHRHQFLDLDAQLSPPLTETMDIEQWGDFHSQEARLSGDTGRLEWIVGGYYYDSSQDYSVFVTIPPVVSIQQTPISVYSHGVAGFGQATYSLTDQLRLTGGLRYSHDLKHGRGVFTLVTPGGPQRSPFSGRTGENRLDWKAGIEADVGPHSLAYANVQTGFNQGGFSFAPASTPGGNQFAPEELVAYTAGIKNRFADGRVQINLEAFYYNYDNYQVSARNLNNGLDLIYNAQKAEVYGLQIDSNFRITPNDRLDASLGLLHAEATRLVLPASAGQADYSGYELPASPPITFTASYEHVFDLPNGATLTPRISTHYVSARWSAYNHFQGSRRSEYDKTDLQLTYTSADERWSIEAYVRNITNVAVWNAAVAAGFPGPAAGFLEPPRTFGVQARVNF